MDFPGGSDGKASVYNVETWVRSLGREDSLEKEMATHSSTLAQKIPWMEDQATVRGVTESDTTERLHFHPSLSCIGEGNGNPHT